MKTFLFSGAALLLALAACQSGKVTQHAPNPQDVPPAGKVASAAGAKAAVGYYLSRQPNAALFVLDSASVVEAGPSFQVLVPRTDWRNRRPSRAAFEVDKASGQVSTRAVK